MDNPFQHCFVSSGSNHGLRAALPDFPRGAEGPIGRLGQAFAVVGERPLAENSADRVDRNELVASLYLLIPL